MFLNYHINKDEQRLEKTNKFLNIMSIYHGLIVHAMCMSRYGCLSIDKNVMG